MKYSAKKKICKYPLMGILLKINTPKQVFRVKLSLKMDIKNKAAEIFEIDSTSK